MLNPTNRLIFKVVAATAFFSATILSGCGKIPGYNPPPKAVIYENTQWPGPNLTFSFSVNVPNDLRDQIKLAMNTWNMAAGCQFITVREPDVSFTDRTQTASDGVNAILLDPWVNGKQHIALTAWKVIHGENRITEADIFFNNRDFIFIDALALVKKEVDLETVALHELGHALGIAHADPATHPDSVMVPLLHTGRGHAVRNLDSYALGEVAKRYNEICGK